MNTEQIVAEARKRFIQERDCALTPNDERIFDECVKTVIEKAVEPWKQRYELALSDLQRRGEKLDRAAHASEEHEERQEGHPQEYGDSN